MPNLDQVGEHRSHSMAARELGAFMSAVAELYGPDQARIAAEDWIRALESRSEVFSFTTGEWRKLTIVAASQLATRVLELGYRPKRLNLVRSRIRTVG